jgi:hypothetical protein
MRRQRGALLSFAEHCCDEFEMDGDVRGQGTSNPVQKSDTLKPRCVVADVLTRNITLPHLDRQSDVDRFK